MICGTKESTRNRPTAVPCLRKHSSRRKRSTETGVKEVTPRIRQKRSISWEKEICGGAVYDQRKFERFLFLRRRYRRSTKGFTSVEKSLDARPSGDALILLLLKYTTTNTNTNTNTNAIFISSFASANLVAKSLSCVPRTLYFRIIE